MPNRPTSLPLVAALLVAVATPAVAQESPAQLTSSEWRCTQQTARGVSGYAGDAAGCIAECEIASRTDPLRFCGPFGFDFETEFCLSRARTRPQVGMLRKCAAEACPECYFGGNCEFFPNSIFDSTEFLTSTRLQPILCDDRSSPDGSSRDEERCTERLLRASDKLNEQLRKCAHQCQKQRQRGRVEVEACDFAALDGNGADDRLQLCVDKARIRFLRSCVKCDDPPECWGAQNPPLDCPAALRLVESSWSSQEPSLFCVDRPVCGDGFVTEGEECDPGSFPSACSADGFCNDACECESFPVCGDGLITGFELCDQSATPTGCPSDEVCVDCFTCAPDSCGAATPVGPAGGTFFGATFGSGSTTSFCGGSGPEDVYVWTPDRSGLATAETCGSSFDTVLYVREVTCDSAARQLACNDDSCGLSSRISFTVQAGTTYYVFVDGLGFGSSGSYRLQITPPGTTYGSPQRAFLQSKTGLLD
jgi:hypothetical protein